MWASTNMISSLAVELGREESRGRLQDLIRPAQLPHFPLQQFEPLPLIGRQTALAALVDLNPTHPLTDGLRGGTQPLRNRTNRLPLKKFYRMLDELVIDPTELFNDRLQAWEIFYNFNRPHGALDGQTPTNG